MNDIPFDELTDIYDAMIDWPARLANEAPFFRRLFEAANVQRVADVACGTGHHAAMFHSWGLEVHGSDASPGMIDRARQTCGEPQRLRWAVRSFEEPAGPSGSFDALICIGNSLALADEQASVERALRAMFQSVRSGGLVIVHVLNLWKLAPGRFVWQKARRVALPAGAALILKGVHRCAERGHIELAVVQGAAAGEVSMRSHSVTFLGLEAEQLLTAARQSGAGEVEFYANYQQEPYDRLTSTDLIMVARRT